MPTSDAFALKNSSLNEFLFAEVGNEVNGTPLTVLSLLARLGKDPWTEAARFARLPRAAMIDHLVAVISQMPLCQQALTDAHATAVRVVSLLPSQAPSIAAISGGKARFPGWVPFAVFGALVACGIAYEMMGSSDPAGSIPPLTQSTPLGAPPHPAAQAK
jgi:hypothetical protein